MGVDGDVEGGGLGVGASEEVTGVPGDLVSGEGDIEGALAEDIAGGIEGGGGEVDGALCTLIGEGVEVELLLTFGDVIGDGLGAFHTALACSGIEGTAAAGVFELHLGHVLRVVVGDDEAAEGYDAVEGEREVDGVGGDGDVFAVEEGVAVAVAVVELYLSGVGHRGVALAAVRLQHRVAPTGADRSQPERKGTPHLLPHRRPDAGTVDVHLVPRRLPRAGHLADALRET